MPYVTVNAARLYYEQHGAGPDLVFLHGAGGNHLVWWQQVAEFSRSFRCTTFDARGWGLSRGEMAIGRFSLGTDLVALLDHLGIEKAHVVAQSMGGRAVAGLARLAPHKARSLVLCGTTAGATDDRVRELQDELRDERGDGALREHALAPGFEAAHPGLALLYRQLNAMNPPRPKGLLGRPPSTYRGSTHEMLGALGIPILYIVGEHDLITSPEMIRQAQALIPGAEYYELLGAGHSCYFERADEWNRVVGGFLARAEGWTPGK
jgi:pimeloyl-ACP methyl ester carboxylesterase